MGRITTVSRTAHLAWSPANHTTVLFATGTTGTASSLDNSGSEDVALEVFQFEAAHKTPVARGRISLDSKIFGLKWSANVQTYGQATSAGVLAAGVDGGILLYSAEAVLSSSAQPILKETSKHVGAVHAIDFSPLVNNLLATGASESDIFVWDLNVAGHCTPAGPKSYPLDDVASVAFNRQISHILASAFASRCVLWDLRKNEAVIKLADQSSRIKYKSVEWNPFVATQLAICSQDDHEPVIQLWDLRKGSAPFKTLEGHQRGILSAAWNQQDPDILLSAGKDGNVFAFNVNESAHGEIIYAMPQSNQWAFELSWCPRIPSVFAACYYDQRIDIAAVLGSPEAEQEIAGHSTLSESFPGFAMTATQPFTASRNLQDIRKAPKWLRQPGSCSFGADGKLAVCHATQDGYVLDIRSGLVDRKLIERAEELERHMVAYQEREFCDAKTTTSLPPVELEEWKFIKACFQPETLLPLLGYHSDVIPRPAHENGSIDRSDSLTLPEQFRIKPGVDVDGTITKALLAGNLSLAVDLCFTYQKEAEALLLSLYDAPPHLPELFRKTEDLFFASKTSNLSKLIRVVTKRDMQFLIEQCSPNDWREAVAVLLNYGDSKELSMLMQLLGDRLQAETTEIHRRCSVICYICAGVIEKCVDVWMRYSPKSYEDAAEFLQNTVEKTLIALRAFGGPADRIGDKTVQLFESYALYLVAQGRTDLALRIVNLVSNSNNANLNKLKQRLWNSMTRQKKGQKSASNSSSYAYPGRSGYPSSTGTDPWQSQQPSRSPVRMTSGYGVPDSSRSQQVHPLLGPPYNQPFPPSPAPVTMQPTVPSPAIHPSPDKWNNVSLQREFSDFTPVPRPMAYGFQQQPSYSQQPFSSSASMEPPTGGYYDPSSTASSRSVSASSSFESQRVTSYQSMKPVGGWNDPPPLLLGRRTSSSSASTPAVPVPLTAPIPHSHSVGETPVHPPPYADGPPYSLHPHGTPQLSTHPSPQPSVPAVSGSTVLPHGSQSGVFVPSVTPPPAVSEVKEKPPIPTEFLSISEGFKALLKHVRDTAVNSGDTHTVRRLEDVKKRRDSLDDLLRHRMLPAHVTGQLEAILNSLQAGDPNTALQYHSYLSTQNLAGDLGSFLVAVKVLIQLSQRATT